MVQSCFPSGCFPAPKPMTVQRKAESHAESETLAQAIAVIDHGKQAESVGKLEAGDSSSTASASPSAMEDFAEPAEEPSPEMLNVASSRPSSAVGSQVFTSDFAALFANSEAACSAHQVAVEASKLMVRHVVFRTLDRQQKLPLKEVDPIGSSNRIRTESELAKALGLRRAGTTHENSPEATSADARNELALFTVSENGAGAIAADLRHESADTQLAALLQLRRAGTTHENYPEQRVVECEGAAPEGKSSVRHLKLSKLKRHDFGVGIARCIVCKSIPRCNRGCADCKQRICRRCFTKHVCPDLADAQELADDEARSTPSVKI